MIQSTVKKIVKKTCAFPLDEIKNSCRFQGSRSSLLLRGLFRCDWVLQCLHLIPISFLVDKSRQSGHFMYTMPKNYFIREQDTYTIPKRSFDRELESIYSSHQPKSSIKSFLEWGCTKNILKYMFVWPLWRGGAEKMTCAQLTARPLATSAYINPTNLWFRTLWKLLYLGAHAMPGSQLIFLQKNSF